MSSWKAKASFALASVLALAATKSANAAILLNDTFDTYADQAAFQTAWPVIGATPSGTLTSAQSVSPPNSINYGTVAQRNQNIFSESGVPTALNPVTFSFDFYDSNAALAPYRQQTNLQDGTAPSLGGQLISMGLNNNVTSAADGGNYYMARILGYDGGTGASAYFKLNQGAAPLRSTGWHNLKAVISDTQIQFYVDGILASTEVTAVAATRSYEVVRLGSGLTSTAEAFYDNVHVNNDAVPEPASLSLLGLGGLALLHRARRAR